MSLFLIFYTVPQIGFYSGYFPQLTAVVQPLLLGVLQNLTYSLNFSYENFIGYKNLGCFEFSMSLFLIF
jgi:hypothetical protein